MKAASAAREQRLAAALRENLKRRKARARAIAQLPKQSGDDTGQEQSRDEGVGKQKRQP